MKAIRLYTVDESGVRKVGNFNTREDALSAATDIPIDIPLIYTIVDMEDPVASSMIMAFYRS